MALWRAMMRGVWPRASLLSAKSTLRDSLIQALSVSVVLLLCTVGEGAEVKEELQKFGDKVSDVANEIAEVKGGQLWCPMPALGNTKCPSSSPFHYYKCCGQLLNNECCLHLQTWALILLVAFGVGVAAVILLSVLRCVFCRRNN